MYLCVDKFSKEGGGGVFIMESSSIKSGILTLVDS
jgi:hypothetical protein